MPDKDNKILKYNHGEKSLKVPFMIYADLECLLEKCIHVKIILKKLIQRKNSKHTPSGYSLFTNCSFDSAEHSAKNKLDCYRDKDCMENFCKNLRQHAMRIVNYEKKRYR